MKALLILRFDGHKLEIRTTTNILKTYPAVSGKPNKGKFDYSIERQRLANQGPIPSGAYWISPVDIWENSLVKSILRSPRSSWGDYRVTVRVTPGTQTYSRGGFFIHGGESSDIPGSAGCIDLTNAMNQFIKDLKSLPDNSKECFIPLTVEYADAK